MVQTVSDSSRYFVINPTEGPHLGKYNDLEIIKIVLMQSKSMVSVNSVGGEQNFAQNSVLENIVIFYFQNLPFLGLGFSDRSDSFDFNMALSDHFKGLRVDFEIAKEEEEPRELLDLSLKEGQTIKVGK